MNTSVSIRFASLDDINTIGYLAQQIWPKTYAGIVPSEQLDYMLNLFYSPVALQQQILESKHQFLIMEQEEEPVGFASWSETDKPGTFKLHKLYLLPETQGKGMGKTMLEFICEDIRPQGANSLRLNVNRQNKARQFYERMGFSIIGEEDIHIGNDYYMIDYVMEKEV
jgi:diamine N-acetyltransferase